MITRTQLINRYIEFFKLKEHKEIPNSSLIPENDPTVLFTTSGMHPLVPYLLGELHPIGKRLVGVQKCIRTCDIDLVGDEFHHTFFEMLGNWSLGNYWKKEAIEMSFEFLIKVLKLLKEKLAISVYSKDEESIKIWRSLGISKERIALVKNNWWGPAGKTGPCGPDTEMFYWKSSNSIPKEFNPNDKNWIEIWNDVFMEYKKNELGELKSLNQKNVDTGMGMERTLAVLNKLEDDYLTECFKPIIEKIEKVSAKKYKQNKKEMRIIADHIKASVFIIADGILPSNIEQGYVLRRLIRRAVNCGRNLHLQTFCTEIAEPIFEIYKDYSELIKNKKIILEELKKEEKKFNQTLEKGVNLAKKITKKDQIISGKNSFLLYQSYGIPIEVLKEIVSKWGGKVDDKGFQEEFTKHQKLSRTATAGKFKSGLADHSEATTKLHTAAHLLLAALREILKDKTIMQKGSNITSERLRLDFSFPRKLTEKEIQDIEDLVNAKIQQSCKVIREEMSPEQAKEKGALGAFEKKYGEKVSVYSIANFSKEICAGPHVKNTCELGHFKIIKEESSGSGVRRIKAILK